MVLVLRVGSEKGLLVYVQIADRNSVFASSGDSVGDRIFCVCLTLLKINSKIT